MLGRVERVDFVNLDGLKELMVGGESYHAPWIGTLPG